MAIRTFKYIFWVECFLKLWMILIFRVENSMGFGSHSFSIKDRFIWATSPQIWDLLADLQVHCSNETKGWTNQKGFFGIFLFRRCPFLGGVHCSLICHRLLWERTESFVFRGCGLTPGSSKSPLADHILTPKPEGFYLWRCSMKSRIENLKVGEHVFDHVIILEHKWLWQEGKMKRKQLPRESMFQKLTFTIVYSFNQLHNLQQ